MKSVSMQYCFYTSIHYYTFADTSHFTNHFLNHAVFLLFIPEHIVLCKSLALFLSTVQYSGGICNTNGALSDMDRPPQNPDLNVFETAWDHLDREWNKRQKQKSSKCPSRDLDNYS